MTSAIRLSVSWLVRAPGRSLIRLLVLAASVALLGGMLLFVGNSLRTVAGSAVRIKQISAPPEILHRLRELGFCEEQQIRLVSRQTNLICQVCNARLGISTQLAETILVEPLAPPTAG